MRKKLEPCTRIYRLLLSRVHKMKPFPFAIWPNTLQKSNSPQEITGNIFDSDSDAIVNTVNVTPSKSGAPVMGAGLAKQFRDIFGTSSPYVRGYLSAITRGQGFIYGPQGQVSRGTQFGPGMARVHVITDEERRAIERVLHKEFLPKYVVDMAVKLSYDKHASKKWVRDAILAGKHAIKDFGIQTIDIPAAIGANMGQVGNPLNMGPEHEAPTRQDSLRFLRELLPEYEEHGARGRIVHFDPVAMSSQLTLPEFLGTQELPKKNWREEFDASVRRGEYSAFLRNLGKIHSPEQLREISRQIRQSHIDDAINSSGPISDLFKDAKIGDDGSTVMLPQETHDYLRQIEPTMRRVMVGNHGIYLESENPDADFVREAPMGQYDEYRKNGRKYYHQKQRVNYADYEPGKWYAALRDYNFEPQRITLRQLIDSQNPFMTEEFLQHLNEEDTDYPFEDHTDAPVKARGILSNFSPQDGGLIVNGKRYKTPEHLYQSLKFKDSSHRQQIVGANTAREAKQISRRLSALSEGNSFRTEWQDIQDHIMRWVVSQRMEQQPLFRQALLATGDRPIIEDEESRPRTRWGTKRDGQSFRGQNVMGKILMSVRDQYRAQANQDRGEDSPPTSSPASIDGAQQSPPNVSTNNRDTVASFSIADVPLVFTGSVASMPRRGGREDWGGALPVPTSAGYAGYEGGPHAVSWKPKRIHEEPNSESSLPPHIEDFRQATMPEIRTLQRAQSGMRAATSPSQLAESREQMRDQWQQDIRLFPFDDENISAEHVKMLKQIARHHPSENGHVLTCWEDLTSHGDSPSSFCHRRFVAQGIQNHTGVPVPDIAHIKQLQQEMNDSTSTHPFVYYKQKIWNKLKGLRDDAGQHFDLSTPDGQSNFEQKAIDTIPEYARLRQIIHESDHHE